MQANVFRGNPFFTVLYIIRMTAVPKKIKMPLLRSRQIRSPVLHAPRNTSRSRALYADADTYSKDARPLDAAAMPKVADSASRSPTARPTPRRRA